MQSACKPVDPALILLICGEPVGIRTRDLLIKSQLLYRLSYGLLPRRQDMARSYSGSIMSITAIGQAGFRGHGKSQIALVIYKLKQHFTGQPSRATVELQRRAIFAV